MPSALQDARPVPQPKRRPTRARAIAAIARGLLLLASFLGFPGVPGAWITTAMAQVDSAPAPTLPPGAKRIERGAVLTLSRSGQEFFYKNFKKIVDAEWTNPDFGIDNGGLDQARYEAKKPLTERALRELLSKTHNDARAKRIAAAFESLQKTFREKFEGFELRDPRFRVLANGVSYGLAYSRFGIRLDPEKTAKRPEKNSVVLVVEAEISSLQVSAQGILGEDLSNPWLGRFGLKAPRLSYLWPGGSQATPLRVQFPLLVTVQPARPVTIRALPATTNLQRVSLGLDYGQLVLPRVALVINGIEFPIDTTEIQTELERQKIALVQGLQAFLKDSISTDMTALFGQLVQELFQPYERGYFDTTIPPLAPNDLVQPLVLGFEPTRLTLSGDAAVLEASGAVEDPILRSPPPLPPVAPAPRQLSIRDRRPHLALSLKAEFFDRLLQHSFQRGYLKNIELDPKTRIDLVLPPALKLGSGSRTDRAVLKLRIKTAAPRTLNITDGYVIFDIDLKVRLRIDGQAIEVINEELDLNTLRVSQESINWLGPLVRSQVVERLKKSNEGYRAEKSVLTRVELPERISSVALLPAGASVGETYLTLYFNFEVRPLDTP